MYEMSPPYKIAALGKIMCYRKETFETYEAQAKAEAPGITKADYEKRFSIIYEKMHDYAQKRRLEVNANIKDMMDISVVQQSKTDEGLEWDPDAQENTYYNNGTWVNNIHDPPDYGWSQFDNSTGETDINASQSKGFGKGKGSGKGTCFKCGQPGHMARNCQSTEILEGKGKGKGKGSRQCFICCTSGHLAAPCWSNVTNKGSHEGGGKEGCFLYWSVRGGQGHFLMLPSWL